jgi:hypothetical protein
MHYLDGLQLSAIEAKGQAKSNDGQKRRRCRRKAKKKWQALSFFNCPPAILSVRS